MRWHLAAIPLLASLAGCHGPYMDPLVGGTAGGCVPLSIPATTPPPSSSPAPPGPDEPCETVALARRVSALQQEGRLDRAHREIETFVARCPSRSAVVQSLREGALAALASDEHAEKLIADGIAARGIGLRQLGQALIDRGLFALERQTGQTATADVHPLGEVEGVFLAMKGPSFSRDSKVFAAGHGPHVSVYSTRTGRERMRLTHPRLAAAEVSATEITSEDQISAYAKHGDTHLRVTWSLADGKLVSVEDLTEGDWSARVQALGKQIRRVSLEPPDEVLDTWVSIDPRGDVAVTVPRSSDEGLRERPEATIVDHRLGRTTTLESLRADAVREVHLGAGVLVTAGDRDASWGWDLRTGRPFGRVVPATGVPLASPFVQAISPDGGLVTNRAGEALELWSITGETRVTSLSGHQKSSEYREAIDSAAFSADGRLVATGDDTGTLRIFEAATGKLVRAFDVTDQEIKAIAWSPDGRLVATAADGESAIRLRDVASGATVSMLPMETDEIEHLRFSADGRRIVGASFTESAAVWDVTSCTVAPLDRPSGFMTGIDLAPDGSFVVASFAEAGVQVWDGEGRRLSSMQGPEPGSFAEMVLRSISLSPDGRLLALGTRSGTLLFRAPELVPVALVAQLARDDAAYVLELSGERATWPVVKGRFDVVGQTAVPPVICRVGPRVLPMEACEERLYDPGLLAHLLAPEAPRPASTNGPSMPVDRD